MCETTIEVSTVQNDKLKLRLPYWIGGVCAPEVYMTTQRATGLWHRLGRVLGIERVEDPPDHMQELIRLAHMSLQSMDDADLTIDFDRRVLAMLKEEMERWSDG